MEKLNIAEILKDCPKGMELDCTMYDDVTLKEVDINNDNYPIQIETTKSGFSTRLTKYGQNITVDEAKCVIFPKDKTTWEGFQRPFKDGDIIFTHANCLKVGVGNTWISIFKESRNGGIATYVDYAEDGRDYYSDLDGDKALLCMKEDILRQRYATEEEKQKLFKAIKDNGYKWNQETKTLEKLIEPKFKVGDKIRHKTHVRQGNAVTEIKDTHYILDDELALPFTSQDNYELVSVVPKFKVGDRITNGKVSITIGHIDDNYYYEIGRDIAHRLFIENQDDWRLEKFDITTLKPFESKVLVRTNNGKWVAAFYSHYDKESSLHYCVVGGLWYKQCIPYNDETKHLLDTTNECDDFYKNL